jgi:hypothetical protein
MPVSGFLLVAALAAMMLVVGTWLGAKRRKELATWAAQHGMSHRAEKDRGFEERFPGLACLRRGHSRYAQNVMEGQWDGRRALAFDYRYITGHGKDQSTHRFSAAIVASDVPLRPLGIRPEGILDRVTEFFGVDDIDFESAEFSRAFHVTSGDKRWAYDVIHQRTMEFLLAAPRFSIQFDERHVIAWRNRRFRPETFAEALDLIGGMLERLPEYVIRDQTGRTGGTA